MRQRDGEMDAEDICTAEESHYFDRKSARIKPNDLAKTIVAFANATGGKVAVGIENDKTISGFKHPDARNIEDYEQVNIVECLPSPAMSAERMSVKNSRGEDDQVLLLDVEASTDTVIRRKSDGAVFLRQGDESKQLNDQQIRALEYDKNQRLFEDESVDGSSLEDIDRGVMDRYKKLLNTEASDERVLRSRGFMKGESLTKAAVLLFAEYPGKYLPQARVRVLRYEGSRMETGRNFNVVKDVTFDGSIPKIIEEAADLIRNMLREFQYLGDDGAFQTIPEYPEFAWIEGIVNAVTHRDYAFAGDYIRVSMYDDRLEIQSPGRLPNIVTLDNMRETRYARNPKIARTLTEFGWVRELNEGVKRIYSEMQAMFLNDPEFTEPNGSAVRMVLKNSITSRVLRRGDAVIGEIGEEAFQSLNEYELAAVQYVYGKGKTTVSDLSKHLGRSVNVARKTLKDLTKKDILAWHGTSQNDPSQYYSLIEQSK